MPYMTDFMDIHRRIAMYATEDELKLFTPLHMPGIWVCRELETLHLELHSHGIGHRKEAQNLRIACRYVSRVCPRMRDLRLMFPLNCMYPNITDPVYSQPYVLEAGLCLLSRLTRLERLRVECQEPVCNISELNWLCRSGRTAEHRDQRRAIVNRRADLVLFESWVESDRLSNTTLGTEILGTGAQDNELMAGLKNLGLMQDVKDMVAEMDTDDFVLLPELRQLACGRHLEQSPEKEMRSIFYVKPTNLSSWISSLSLI